MVSLIIVCMIYKFGNVFNIYTQNISHFLNIQCQFSFSRKSLHYENKYNRIRKLIILNENIMGIFVETPNSYPEIYKVNIR